MKILGVAIKQNDLIICQPVRFKKWLWNLLCKIGFKFCNGANGVTCFRKGSKRIQNTKYVEESKNIVFLCEECHEINEDHWKTQWEEYYKGL